MEISLLLHSNSLSFYISDLCSVFNLLFGLSDDVIDGHCQRLRQRASDSKRTKTQHTVALGIAAFKTQTNMCNVDVARNTLS